MPKGPQTEYVFSRDAVRIVIFIHKTLNSSLKILKAEKARAVLKKTLVKFQGRNDQNVTNYKQCQCLCFNISITRCR